MSDHPDPLSARSLISGLLVGLIVTIAGGVIVYFLTQSKPTSLGHEQQRDASPAIIPAQAVGNALPRIDVDSSITPAVVTPMFPIYAETPTSLTLDFPFNIETDGKQLLIKYPKEEDHPILFKGKCQKMRQPLFKGPKVFEKPGDPYGKVHFRIYPIREGDVQPCPE